MPCRPRHEEHDVKGCSKEIGAQGQSPSRSAAPCRGSPLRRRDMSRETGPSPAGQVGVGAGKKGSGVAVGADARG